MCLVAADLSARDQKLAANRAKANLDASSGCLSSRAEASTSAQVAKPSEAVKQPDLSKATEGSKRHAAELEGRHKKKAKADNPIQPKLVDQDRVHPPSDVIGFKDGKLAACLCKVAILPEDYDACCRPPDQE